MSKHVIVVTSSMSTSFLYNHYVIDASGGNITLTLGSVTSNGIHFVIVRSDTSSNVVTIQPSLSQLINGNDYENLLIGGEIHVTSYNGQWIGNVLNRSSGDMFMFGDGSDGNVTISANTSLTRDMYYNNLTIDPGIVVSNSGYRIFVRGILTHDGDIDNSGVAGLNGSGAGGIGGLEGTLGGGFQGGTGPPILSGGGGGNGGGTNLLGGTGGNGGNANTGGGPGGTGGGTAPSTNSGGKQVIKALPSMLSGRDLDGNKLFGGAGGGGGGATTNFDFGASGGGGGGGILISANTIIGTGTFTAKGGKGGNTNPSSTFGGAGGGGGGGFIICLYGRNYISSANFIVTGGLAGSADTPATQATAGGAGTLLLVQV